MRLSRREVIAAAATLGGCARAEESKMRFLPPHTRAIPATGEHLPVVGLGTWQAFDLSPTDAEWPQARDTLQLLVERAAKVVDSSPMYGRAEAAVGQISAGLQLRPALFLATKVWTRGRQAGIAQMEASQRLLHAPVIDLMQVHNLVDLEIHLPTLQAWKDAGRIRYVGVTHYDESGYAALEAAMRRHPLDFIQINASVAERAAEARILPLAAERGMAVLINRPFAGGDLFARVRRLSVPGWAVEIGAATWAQVLLKYVLADAAVTCVIPGTNNPRHLMDNLGAAYGPLPDAAHRRRILEAVAAA